MKEIVGAFERILEFTPAFDRTNSKNPKENYGVHGVEMRFVLKTDKGAVQFVLFTNWQLTHVTDAMQSGFGAMVPSVLARPLPADLGFHSPKPMYDTHEPQSASCPYLDGKRCYYDGSSLNAIPVFEALVHDGEDGVWRNLEKYYKAVFEEEAPRNEFGTIVNTLENFFNEHRADDTPDKN